MPGMIKNKCEKCEFKDDCDSFKVLLKYDDTELKKIIEDNCYDFREVV